jgi:hypothetical protein
MHQNAKGNGEMTQMMKKSISVSILCVNCIRRRKEMKMEERSVMIWWVGTDVSHSSAETLYAVSTAGTYCAV